MFVATPILPDDVPLARGARSVGRIVWQQHYEGISHVAYRGGKAIAGVSGPWSDRYVLIWWDRPQAPNPLELFATLDEAMRAVEDYAGEAIPQATQHIIPRPRRRWWQSLWPRPRGASEKLESLRRRLDVGIDLSGLSFSATR